MLSHRIEDPFYGIIQLFQSSFYSILRFSNNTTGLTANIGSCQQLPVAGDLASSIFDSCQAEKLPERKDAHRKPLLPNLTGS
jgi:hypothetical protein